VDVNIVEVPDEFVAGARPETLTVVASKRSGRQCLKVRWSMVLQLEGLSLEQVRVDRIEDDGSFPVDLRAEGDGARLTDERLDPGTLCRDRTVTARYEVNVANDVLAGRMTLLTEAYDANQRLLERDGATRSVVNPLAPAATPEPTPEATGAAAGGAQAPGSGAADQAAAGQDREGLPLVWFLIGGLMVFLGLSLLLNVRGRQRRNELETAPIPAGISPDRLSRYRTVPRRPRDW
jgi:hypothetical protein